MNDLKLNPETIGCFTCIVNAMLLTDGYKLGHKIMYPENMTKLYSNITPRGAKYMPDATEGAVVFGIQYFIKKYLIDGFKKNFFDLPEDTIVKLYHEFLVSYLGKETADMIGVEHVRELHKLGYFPIRIKALPEGAYCPIGVPYMTITNTNPKFAWLTNYIESITSNVIWHPVTAATIADIFKRELIRHAIKTGFYNPDDTSNINFLCHDFSMRGMSSLESTIECGMAWLTSFCGSESVPAIVSLPYFYPVKDKTTIAGTIPASEHSVECTNAFYQEDGCNEDPITPEDIKYFERMLNKFKDGFISIVADGFDYWHFLTKIVPQYKDQIMQRNGRVVIRPDSGDPVKIICGDPEAEDPFVRMGSYEFLWNTFGGTFNEKGYKVLDSHIGMIYGDSINVKRQKEIYKRLEEKGFAATNLCLGCGSFSISMVSRDSLGQAMKATYFEVTDKNGNVTGMPIYKDPKTVCGTPKKSHKGLLCVLYDPSEQKYVVEDNCTPEQEAEGYLVTVFENGKHTKEYTFDEIRARRADDAYAAVLKNNTFAEER